MMMLSSRAFRQVFSGTNVAPTFSYSSPSKIRWGLRSTLTLYPASMRAFVVAGVKADLFAMSAIALRSWIALRRYLGCSAIARYTLDSPESVLEELRLEEIAHLWSSNFPSRVHQRLCVVKRVGALRLTSRCLLRSFCLVFRPISLSRQILSRRLRMLRK